MTDIARELEGARQKLLDLTLRNRLLNYRPSQLRSIRVIGELPAEIYDALVLREKTLEFRGTGRKKSSSGASGSSEFLGGEVASADELDQRQPPEGLRGTEELRGTQTWFARDAASIESKHTDRFLQTPYDDESLGKKLFRVYHVWRLSSVSAASSRARFMTRRSRGVTPRI